MPVGHYSVTSNFFANPVVNSPLTGTAGYLQLRGKPSFPSSSYNNSYYFVDVAFVPVTVPAAPSGVTATKGDETATVSWTAPYNGGKAISSYMVTPYRRVSRAAADGRVGYLAGNNRHSWPDWSTALNTPSPSLR